MFDQLNIYKYHDHFFFNGDEKLKEVCNAPSDKSGVYLVYSLKKGKIELVYIGRSGKMNDDQSIFVRKTGLGGIKDRIVNGYQFAKIPRHVSWPVQMKYDKIEALDVYWYVTHDDENNDCPSKIEKKLLKVFLDVYGVLPKWNKKM